MPVGLIREIDESIVAGLGGYSTRTEFFRDAAEGLLLELKYEPAPVEPRAVASSAAGSESGPDAAADEAGDNPGTARTPTIAGLEATALRLAADGKPLADGLAAVDDDPLFGMHNRDFPSLWVAFQLAAKAVDGPVPYEPFVAEVTEEAWGYAEALTAIEATANQKLTALFPTNRAKPQSASDGFRTFAIGWAGGDDGNVRAEGPLFLWRVCQVARSLRGDLLLGLTSEGWGLLRSIEGLSLEMPHAPEHARTFLRHLRDHAPADWWGFQTVLGAISEQPTRIELVDAFQRGRPDWTSSVTATNSQGYLARAREWGLVHPKQLSGRYGLTDFGEAYLAEITHDPGNTGKEGTEQ
jgi:hypothetical protein